MGYVAGCSRAFAIVGSKGWVGKKKFRYQLLIKHGRTRHYILRTYASMGMYYGVRSTIDQQLIPKPVRIVRT